MVRQLVGEMLGGGHCWETRKKAAQLTMEKKRGGGRGVPKSKTLQLSGSFVPGRAPLRGGGGELAVT